MKSLAMSDETSKRMTRRDMRREATRAAVIEAARTVFLENGYEGATIKLISDKANVSPGTVLNAAPSKAALLIQILDEEFEAIGESINQMEGVLSGSFTDRLTALLQISLEKQSEYSELFAAAYGHCWLYQDEVYEQTYSQLNNAWNGVRKLIEGAKTDGALQSDLDVNLCMNLLMSIYFGVFHRACHENISTGKANQLLRARLDLMLRGWIA